MRNKKKKKYKKQTKLKILTKMKLGVSECLLSFYFSNYWSVSYEISNECSI